MKRLQSLARAQKGLYYSLFGLAVVLGIVIITQSYFIVSIVDDLFLNKLSFQHVTPLLIALLIVLLLRAVISYFIGRIGNVMAALVKASYRKKLLEAYSNQTILTSYKGQSGKKVSVMLDAVDELDGFFSKYIPQQMITTIVSVIILVAVFSQHVYSGLIILFTAPFIPLFMIIIGKATQQKSEEKLDSLSSFSGRFLDTIQGLVSLKLYGRTKHYRDVIQSSSIHFRDSTMGILKVAFTSSLMLEFISMLSVGLVALELGLRLVVFNSINFFTAFFILLLVPEFFHLLKELGSAFHAGRSSNGAANKIEESLAEEDTRVRWGEEKLEKGPMSIELDNVSFSYESEKFSLQHIQATLPTTGLVTIVGKSGSGKTTLLHCLAGLLDCREGRVLLNGVDRSLYNEKDWFANVSYITQSPFLFSGTVAENITLGLQATGEELEEAARKANILNFIQSMPNGFETYIGEGGRGLSGGEKQRIALARAFLKKPSIVLFDEPTSGLDLKTEKILQKAIEELAQKAIVIAVAHRLPTIVEADHVLFLEKGVIQGQGKHEELLHSSKPYQLLY
ncbi:thiol reductant ABC exporter subunit CydD [Bacillus sp. FJAT-45066]|uniref:thiol reductant ABC exporter subunit CydD n=1 Tax=Bacillus sp. FJAT-45066 TaxID=2011010 RepID=UPI000BB7F574|nr:thiol reductant ABC exporter subunit CydD [Bacillus sp. FJAT-45066]